MTEEVVRETGGTRASLQLLYEISREFAQALDLRTVLQRVLFLSLKTVKGESGSIIVLDEDGELRDSAIIHAGNMMDRNTQQLKMALQQGLMGWVVENREATLVSDTSRDRRWLRGKYDDPDTGARSSVSAPLLVRDRLVGIMTLSHPQSGFFTDNHLELVQTIAGQAAIFVLNASLYDESQQRTRVMTALANSAASINASLNVDDVLQSILEQIVEALEVDAVSLALVDEEAGELEFKAATGSGRDSILGLRIKMGQGVAGWVAQNEEAIIVPDVQKDPRFYNKVDRQTGFLTRAIACVPIRSQDKVIGVIEALNPTGKGFGPDALVVMDGIGHLAGSAIDHARLFEQVEVARSRYLELFEDNVDPILVTVADGKVVESNRSAQRMSGFLEAELKTMNVHQLHAVDWEVLGQNYDNLAGQHPLSYESSLQTKDGGSIDIEVYVRRVNIADTDHFQWILHDITERKRFDKLREDLASMIYHDLRSPLANVVSGLDVLQSMLEKEDPTVQSVIDIAIRSTERVQRLSNSLLDTMRMQSGENLGNPEPVTVEEIVRDAVEAALPGANNKEQQIKVALSASLPSIMVDADMIKRALINLLENSVKYTDKEGVITVGAKRKGGWLHIFVRDTGRGIPPDKIDTIFDKFTRVREGAAGSTAGLGLGLAFCKLAVEGHGGKIWVESEFGKGSTFTFSVPVAS
ncbi:MAG: GAF domain-containing protein [Chloroflexi bacterium]|nr:MAG: GAF domain-containing protein [Chloroflexota bacterium]MBL1194567.1 GAF domain-containing protein [Chloroflexota bacterium]NOH11856.1 GAF domain-containing protein [Chloroflexota bacterium]